MRKFYLFFLLFHLLISSNTYAQQKQYSSSEIANMLQKATVFTSVLYIAAHPDDENTRLLSWLANEKKARTAYLSVTRGDGGQNLIGTEQGEQLGMIRTQELLAARRIDGAEQYFTNAVDFGYSKTPEETLQKWNKQKVLSDMVWVIRTVRPDIIITRFPTTGEGGHGHHTASAILAEEAFKAAGDSKKFPEQLAQVKTWKAKRLVWNTFNFGGTNTTSDSQLKLDIGAYNPLLGKGYGEIAAQSRSQHKSQGFGVALQRGSLIEYFKYKVGATAVNSIFEGIDTSAARVKGSTVYLLKMQEAIATYNFTQPATIVPLLLEAYTALDAFEDAYWKNQKKKELEELIIATTGLWFETTATDFYAAKLDEIKITTSAINRSDIKIQLEKVDLINNARQDVKKELKNNELFTAELKIKVPEFIPYSTPYWLKEQQTDGAMLSAERKEYVTIGSPEVFWAFADFTFTIANKKITFSKPISHKWVDPVDGERYRSLEVLPDVTANFDKPIAVFSDTTTRSIKVTVNAWRNRNNVKIRLLSPENWQVTPEFALFDTLKKGKEYTTSFNIKPLAVNKGKSTESTLRATIQWDDYKSNKSIYHIDYKHIPVQTLLKDIQLKLVQVNVKIAGKNVGYIPGAGDDVAACLKQIGYNVTLLTDDNFESTDLTAFDAIITGIRAYNTNERLPNYRQKLMSYIEQGGNLIVQYNTNNFLSNIKEDIGPYPFKITRDRVTDEYAKVNFDSPTHPVLNYPNNLTEKDFEGWVQERGVYFAGNWDKRYETPISMNDAGEVPNKGSLILSKYGKGYFVYTGLAFFRELPAGVPGAYKLLANIISLGE